jgi:glycosyltransferase involved in cell wall biosynthesis
MKVSIITATYNSSLTILDCVKSINDQTYANIEHIIIDGLSSDNTLSLLKSVPSRITKIVAEPDNGIYDAMNKGILSSTGDIIAILNSDDIYASNDVVETIVKQFQNNKNLGILYGDLHYVKKDNIEIVIRKWKSMNYYNRFFEDGNVPPHPSTFIKRNIYEKVGIFNLKFKLAADYEFMLRAFKLTELEISYIPLLIVRMRLGGATNKSFKNVISGNIEILNSWKENNLPVPSFLFFKKTLKRLAQFL